MVGWQYCPSRTPGGQVSAITWRRIGAELARKHEPSNRDYVRRYRAVPRRANACVERPYRALSTTWRESVSNADPPSEGAKMTCYLLGHVEVVDPIAYRVYAAAVIEQLAAVGGESAGCGTGSGLGGSRDVEPQRRLGVCR